MKKMMIAAAIVCAAVGAEAASCNWDVSKVYDYAAISAPTPAYTKADGYATYFVVATTDFGVDEAKAAIANSDFSWMTSQKVQQNATAMEGGVVAVTETPDTWFGKEETVNAFVVIFDDDSYTDAKHAYVSVIGTDATGGEGQAANISFNATSSYQAINWTTINAVPEPTSGLLLLLGVAGLALRRRRT